MDEPTSGLDPLMEATFQYAIQEEREQGRTVLLSSHILAEVEALCDKVSIIRDGRNVETGTLSEMRHLTRTSINAELAGTPNGLANSDQIHDLKINGNRVRFDVETNALDDVLRQLTQVGVRSLTSQPPTLEELFLRHYTAEPVEPTQGVEMTATLERLDAPPASSGPSHSLVGTWQLTRLALRQDRIILPIWVLVLGLGPSSNAGTYDTIYRTAAERATLTGSIGANPSVAVLYGPAFDLSTAGGYAAWRLGGFMALFVGLMAVFTVTRHTRAEEDTGRAELLASAALGRCAALTAAVMVSGGASVLIGLIEVGTLAGAKLPAAGAVAFGLSTALAGLVFTAIAAVAGQLAEYSRTANGIGAAVVGVAFMLRAIGDSTTGAKWISWLSPIGWAQQTRPFAGERWWVLLLPLVATAAIGAIAYALLPRRDFGAGFLAPRLGPATASPALRSPLALAWRLHRGPLIG
jgi:hypothetical protein